ncbi:signal peptidase I [Methylocapsa sp. S129]|uniref:signal peptidase I n=1 Tax=Methylocapsa sp. S129 TaxID=1641869 RepID=UPI00131CD0FF|nr:signal peptidase I [Methylocapsa sp. S129]
MTEPASLKSGDFEAAAKKTREGGLGTIAFAALAALILVAGRLLLFQPFNIPSGSLIPTLLIGDYVFVSKYSYGYSHFSLPSFLDLAPAAMPGRLFASQPKRGDVIVFKLPRDGQTDYIKRLIGLPGDTIQLRHSRLYINGTIVERTPLPPYSTLGHFGSPIDVPHYEETLPGGVKHEIIQMDGDEGYWDNTNVYTVPPGNYFMMGDNRDNSNDSRLAAEQQGVGFVPFDNFIGRAEMVFFSVGSESPAKDNSGGTWAIRWDRLFQPVR